MRQGALLGITRPLPASCIPAAAAPGTKGMPQELGVNLDGGQVLIELGIQRGKFVHRAVEDAVMMAEQLAQEERGEGDIHHNSLGRRIICSSGVE